MAKARIVTVDGTEMNIDGTPSEIAAVLKELKITTPTTTKSNSSLSRPAKPKSGKTTLPALIHELIGQDFFAKPKSIGDVRTQLADLGHHYPTTSLSGPLQALVRKRRLRRFKKDRNYVYAQ